MQDRKMLSSEGFFGNRNQYFFYSQLFVYKINVLYFLQELEQIEEHYKQETRDLLSTVKKLQDENRKLASSLAAATERDSAFSEDGKFIYLSKKNNSKRIFFQNPILKLSWLIDYKVLLINNVAK